MFTYAVKGLLFVIEISRPEWTLNIIIFLKFSQSNSWTRTTKKSIKSVLEIKFKKKEKFSLKSQTWREVGNYLSILFALQLWLKYFLNTNNSILGLNQTIYKI